MPYIGNQPGTGVRNRFIYTATASQTTFSGADDNGKTLKYADSDFVDVFLNGICLVPVTDYTSTSKTSVVLTQAASLNDTLEVIAYDIATIADTVSKADGGTFDGDVNFLGEITVGNLTQPRIAGQSSNFDIANIGTNFTSSGLVMQRFESGGSSGPSLLLGKSRGANIGDMDIVQDGDELGKLRFYAADGTNMDHFGGEIKVVIDGTPGANDIPSSMVFSTTADGSNSVSEAMRIKSSGFVGINEDTPVAPLSVSGGTTSGTTFNCATFAGGQNSTSGSGAKIYLSGTENDPIARGTFLHGLMVDNGNTHRLAFGLSKGASDPVEVATFDSNGSFVVNATSSGGVGNGSASYIGSNGQLYASSTSTHFVNKTADGNVLAFRSAGTTEGTVSISGTTTSYNGGHLSRWSRLTSGNREASILKGTVMTNLDEMVVWSHPAIAEGDEIKDNMGNTITATSDHVRDAFTEENEQLNCMEVSSVEGDPNVAGVFVNWDNDDDFNDMNVAMTGDMVIRIAKGTTVARGDLLMSAGDGTAKPQGDDIVRSKTIAKVISTNISHTYDDESYLVPCVLMAC
jgi:hypothetical protein